MVAAALLATILTAGRHISGGASGKLGPATRAGTVTGVIAACPGALQYPQRLASVGGMVLVMRGRGGSAVVAKERVQPGKGFSFRLAPGRYVLTAHKKIGRAIPTVVVIRSGLTVRKMIGAECA